MCTVLPRWHPLQAALNNAPVDAQREELAGAVAIAAAQAQDAHDRLEFFEGYCAQPLRTPKVLPPEQAWTYAERQEKAARGDRMTATLDFTRGYRVRVLFASCCVVFA